MTTTLSPETLRLLAWGFGAQGAEGDPKPQMSNRSDAESASDDLDAAENDCAPGDEVCEFFGGGGA